jgi:tetratricopeptide (TPR) repeat protein
MHQSPSILTTTALTLLSLVVGLRVSAQPSGPELYRQGVQLLQAERYSQALASFDRVVQQNPRYAPGYSGRCAAYFALGNGRVALENCNQAILLDPNLAEAYIHRGNVYLAYGDLEAAFSDAEQALVADPKVPLPAAFLILGRVALEQRDYETALDELDKALLLDANLAEAYQRRGQVYQALANEDAAVEDFVRALRLDPRLTPPTAVQEAVVNQLLLDGQDKLDRNEPGAALADFNLALRINPEAAGAYNGRGLVLRAQGNETAALAEFERVLELDENNVVAQEQLAELRPPTPTPAPPATDDTTSPAETTTAPAETSAAPEVTAVTPTVDPGTSPPAGDQRLTEEFCDQMSTDLSLADLEAQIGPADEQGGSAGQNEYTWRDDKGSQLTVIFEGESMQQYSCSVITTSES